MDKDAGRRCTFEGCERLRSSRLHCQSHARQWKKYGEVWELGDKARISAIKRAAWDRLTDEEKAARLAPMQASVKGKPRSAIHSQRLSESIRARYQSGDYNLPVRVCRGCEEEFQSNSNHHFYCSRACELAVGRLKRHGLTNRQYLDMLKTQGGVCALCGTSGKGFGGSRYGLVVDHCHDTGKARGLLCPDCNTALGRFGDDAARLRAAADYLDRTCPH